MNERIALYSSSLYDVAAENGCAKEVYESLMSVKEVFSEHEDYVKILSSASVVWEEREKLIDEAFSGRVHVYVLNFIKILAKKRFCEIFLPCAEEYEKSYFKAGNIEHATITTAIELSEEKKKEIIEKISASTGCEIIAEFVVDSEILGGIVIETEKTSIDASVTGKLESIKRHISKN